MKKIYSLQRPFISSVKILTFLLLSFSLNAQMEITGGNQNPWTPQNLIENVFLGEGVEVTNITYSGVDGAVGYFQDGTTDIGIDRGIIMTTGQAVDGLGPNNSSGFGSNNGSTASCPELNQLTSFNLFNVAAYEITFRPVNDTLRFRYAFASEEYPEYACTSFNDVFGFFITGPNPAGGNYTAENIALIPDLADPTGLTFTNNPVTINNVNGNGLNPGAGCDFDFAQYYNTNTGTGIQYDGYLDVFTAQAIVIPCELYTIKLAISDAGDGIFDTAVFLEAKSFGTGAIEVTAQTVSLDGTLVEGCSDGELCFALPGPAEADVTLDYNFIGSAINGVDFEMIPLDLFIPAGDSSVCWPIIPIDDGIMEPNDSLGIDVQIDPCTRDTFWIYIQDPSLPELVLPPDTTICSGDSIYVDATLPVPLPVPPTFSNNTSIPIEPHNTAIYSDIDVSGVFPIDLQDGIIKRVCIDSLTHKWDDDLDIFLFSPGGQFIELSTDNGQNCDNYINTCFVPGATLTLQDIVPVGTNCSGGMEAGFTGDFQIEGIWSDLWDGGSPTNGTWRLFVLDDSDGFAGDLHGWTICFEPLYQISYSWTPTTGLSCSDCPNPWMSPTSTTTYTLTATDTYGCSTQDSITITVEDVLPAPVVNCGTINPTSITFTWNDVGGATGGYQVNINGQGWIPANGTLEHTVTGLSLNQTVVIEVQGIADCNGEIGTITCMTPDCPAPTGMVANIINNNCFGDMNGSATVTAMGANPPFTFIMDGVIDADGIFDGLPAGDYSVQIVDNVNCGLNVDFTITQPDSIAPTAVLQNNISCNGLTDGEGTMSIVGGTGPFSFAWSTGSSDSIALDLVEGINTVTITDALGCQAIEVIDIIEPEQLTAVVDAAAINCFGGTDGTATVTANGGTIGYTYMWSDGQDTEVAIGLSAQLYTVQVNDANGCTAVAAVSLTQNSEIDLSNTSSTLASCNGVQDGSATVNPSGGAGNYTYAWDVIGNQTTQTALGLTVGTYTVTVTDMLMCTATTTVSVSSPNAISAGYNSAPALCFDSADGQVEVNAMGGTPDINIPGGYTFDWSVPGGNGSMHNSLPAGNHFVTITDANNCFEVLEVEVFAPAELVIDLNANSVNCASGTDGEVNVTSMGGAGGFSYNWDPMPITNPNQPTLSGLSAGWVYVTVTDASGCFKVDSIEITAPNAMVLTTVSQMVDCNGNDTGTATVNASSGAGNFSYLWSDANGQTDPTATGLPAGTYTVTVTDANLCTSTSQVEVMEPTVLTSAIVGNDAVCFGENSGDATVTPDGGTMGYTYAWSGGQSTPTATGLAAGTAMVTITDGSGCVTINSIVIDEPAEVTLSVAGIDVNCFGENDGSATATAGGGAGNFTYNWNDANTQNTPTANGLVASNYSVTVTDGNGCSIIESLQINEPNQLLIIDENIVNLDCNGGDTGAISVSSQGGVGTVSFAWSSGQNVSSINSLSVGTYTLTITDGNLCQATQTYILEEPSPINLSATNTNIDCFNGTDGSIDLTVTGPPAGSYSLVWSGPNGFTSTDEDLTDLAAGDYTVVVTGINDCMIDQMVTVNQPAEPLAAIVDVNDVTCAGGFDGEIIFFPSGGTAPYSYSVDGNNFNGSPTQIGIYAGNYNDAIIQDANGCRFQVPPITIFESPAIEVDLGNDTTIIYGEAYYLNPTVTNAVGNVTYEWSPVDDRHLTCTNCPPPVLVDSLSQQTSYQVVVTDENGCTASDIITIFVKKFRELLIPTGFSPNGDFTNDLLVVHGRPSSTILMFRIYDRWGELVYENRDFDINDNSVGWDGTHRNKPMNPGVYVWYCEVEFEDGEIKTFKGQTTLIR